jgi:pyruvate dehydrogenase E2 component (dihydrolipoamide acetyltransferase)
MDILMPQLGETVAEGKITTWFKAIGDSIKPGDNLFEIETDKVSMEVPATTAGVLTEIRVPAGHVAPVGAVVAIINDASASAKPQPSATPQSTPNTSAKIGAAAPSRTLSGVTTHAASRADALEPFREVRTPERNYGPATVAGGVTVTPFARRLAVEAGIDLTHLAASGRRRIAARDIMTRLEGAGGTGAKPSAPSAHDRSVSDLSADRVKAYYAPGSYEEVPLDSVRKTIATRLLEAKQTIPHFYLTSDVTIERLDQVRGETNAVAPVKDGQPEFKLSINDLVIKALALALQRVPAANAVWAGDRILRFRQSDIGVAVAIEGGLITPVIRGAEAKSVIDISIEMHDLAARARSRRLKPHEYQGGTTAISNLGMYGVREFAAIINPPHATILAVGAGQRRPIETKDGVGFLTQMSVTLSCDHRVVDGALGAQLLAAFKDLVEHPVGLMI